MSLKEFFRLTGVKLFWSLALPIIWVSVFFIIQDCIEYPKHFCRLGDHLSYPLVYVQWFLTYIRWYLNLGRTTSFIVFEATIWLLASVLYSYLIACIVSWLYHRIRISLRR